jgi:hypothetical protein
MSATRILCLHGYHGSATILRGQIGHVIPDNKRLAGFITNRSRVITTEQPMREEFAPTAPRRARLAGPPAEGPG